LVVGGTSAVYTNSNRGNISINGASTALLALSTAGTGRAYLYTDGSRLDLLNTQNDALTFGTNNTERARIDSSGNLGVGTTSPTSVSGYKAIKINSSGTGSLLDLAQADVMRGRLGVNSTQFTIETSGSIPIMFSPAGSEAMRVDSSARLLVGVTTPSISAAQSGEFYGTTTYGYVFTNTTAGNYPVSVWNQGTSGTRALMVFMYGASATITGSITTNGGTTTYNTTSDYRVKEVIGSVSGSGERIDALQPIDYFMKEDGSKHRGFLAHQFQSVYANSVTGEKDAVDAQSKPVYQTMQASSSEVIADLVAEIQDLRKRLATLEAK